MIHLVKLCVGIDNPLALSKAQRKRGKLFHLTRSFPKRASELLDGGSLYWVFSGLIRVRQAITALERVEDQGGNKKCKIILDKKLYLTENFPRRPFQGWRYLENPPPDLSEHDISSSMLKELGLI